MTTMPPSQSHRVHNSRSGATSRRFALCTTSGRWTQRPSPLGWLFLSTSTTPSFVCKSALRRPDSLSATTLPVTALTPHGWCSTPKSATITSTSTNSLSAPSFSTPQSTTRTRAPRTVFGGEPQCSRCRTSSWSRVGRRVCSHRTESQLPSLALWTNTASSRSPLGAVNGIWRQCGGTSSESASLPICSTRLVGHVPLKRERGCSGKRKWRRANGCT
mmetsp:Transcript_16173/g.38555  ORF Transcript_16173/g.38555 Transcript_16173/m.38555 type:complete len:217 (-) Transcript_16173:121-771(-)